MVRRPFAHPFVRPPKLIVPLCFQNVSPSPSRLDRPSVPVPRALTIFQPTVAPTHNLIARPSAFLPSCPRRRFRAIFLRLTPGADLQWCPSIPGIPNLFCQKTSIFHVYTSIHMVVDLFLYFSSSNTAQGLFSFSFFRRTQWLRRRQGRTGVWPAAAGDAAAAASRARPQARSRAGGVLGERRADEATATA